MNLNPRTATVGMAMVGGALCLLLGAPATDAAPLTQLASWEGGLDYFATGAPLAVDGPDVDTTTVDTLSQPASVIVGAGDVPTTADVVAAYLYWAGTINDQNECSNTLYTDDEVMLTVPGAADATAVTADACQCVPGATSYDIQACRADITTLVMASGMLGTFTVDEFAARAMNGATDNASFSLVLVYEEANLLPPRRIVLYDGLEELYTGSVVMTLSGLEVDNPAQGEITWYVLDGDVGGTGPEEVRVQGQPGGTSTPVYDMVNPANNPMNRTINTTTPVQTDVLGVDIDRLDISAGIAPGDTSLEMTYTAGTDKFWVVYNLVGVNVFRPVVNPKQSTKGWALQVDADASGNVTEGDTVRYTIHLSNSGTAPGYVNITDPIPSAFSSWHLVNGAGGQDQSTATELVLVNLWLTVGGSLDILVDAVIGPGTAGSSIINGVLWEVESSGTVGTLVSSPVHVASGPAPDAGVPDAAIVDAAAPDASVPDASPPDGASPDATLGDAEVPDASLVPDAGQDAASDAVILPDALTERDAAEPPAASPVGCGCRATLGPSGEGAAAFFFWTLLLALWMTGRRRRRR